MSIKFLDLFAGIGGFRSGLEAIGGFACVGHCEIDKYANQAYNAIYEPKGEVYYEDGEQTHYQRSDILGILKDEYLPDQARQQLSEQTSPDEGESAGMTMGGI